MDTKRNDLLTAKELIKKAGVIPDDNKDQYFLVDDYILDRIVAEYAPSSEKVLEIGGGVGNLTSRLLGKYEEVIVVEQDEKLANFLISEFPEAKVIVDNALEVDFPDFDVCVSNPPYSISTQLLFQIIPYKKETILTLQKEVAERIVASPKNKDYGRLSVSAQHYADIEILEVLPPTVFEPSPSVESCIVRFSPREPEYTVDDEKFFLTFIKGIFTQRRKKLKNAIENSSHITGVENYRDIPESIYEKRPDELSPKDLAKAAELAK